MSGPNPSGFIPGASVAVIGQGVWMTVVHVFGEGEEQQAVCIWYDTRNRLQRANFFTSLLIHTLPPSSALTGQGIK